MKKITLLFAAICLSFLSFAQIAIPAVYNYQAVVRDANGNLLKNQAVGVQFSVYDQSKGAIVYTGAAGTANTNVNGLLTFGIGDDTAFAAINWVTGGDFSVISRIDPTGGTNYTIIDTAAFLSVPYATNAYQADYAATAIISYSLATPVNLVDSGTGDQSSAFVYTAPNATKIGASFESTGGHLFLAAYNKSNWPGVLNNGALIENQNAAGDMSVGTGGTGSVALYTNNNFTTPDVTVNAGKVGIGTTTPAYPLTVTNTSSYGIVSINGSHSIGIFNGLTNGVQDCAIGTISGDNLNFLTGDQAPQMTLTTDGSLGIGTTTPVAPLDVEGAKLSSSYAYAYLNYYNNPITGTGNSANLDIAIHASLAIDASFFTSHSDVRIKNVIGKTDNAADLGTLMKLQITDYKYKDFVAHGNKTVKKVIAQEVEKVYPNAVNQITDVIPNIYSYAEIANGVIKVKNDLKAGDKVRLILGEETKLVNVIAADANSFTVNLPNAGNVFVYGKQVNDFRTVDYDALSTLNISATQELAKKIATLEEKNIALNNENAKQKATLDAKIATLTDENGKLKETLAAIQGQIQTLTAEVHAKNASAVGEVGVK